MAAKEERYSLLYDYERLLQRLYERLPSRTAKAYRLELPRLEVERAGSRTTIKNFRTICDILRREPRLVMRYLLKELGVSGSYSEESGMLTLNVKVSAATLTTLLQRFMKTYVICPTCNAPDTKLEKKGRAWVLICEACGAEQPVPPI